MRGFSYVWGMTYKIKSYRSDAFCIDVNVYVKILWIWFYVTGKSVRGVSRNRVEHFADEVIHEYALIYNVPDERIVVKDNIF